MENIDPALATRVWQRVQNGPAEAAVPDIPMDLLLGAQSDAQALSALARRLKGRQAEFAQTLAREERAQAACLRGICAFTVERSSRLPAQSNAPESTRSLLRRCYGSHLRRLAEYERRAGDPEFGPAYETLARQERRHCAQLLELLGMTAI